MVSTAKEETIKLINSIASQMPDETDGIESVSYTHLRAHETVLDLVCRLLLEKKKNRIRQHSRTDY